MTMFHYYLLINLVQNLSFYFWFTFFSFLQKKGWYISQKTNSTFKWLSYLMIIFVVPTFTIKVIVWAFFCHFFRTFKAVSHTVDQQHKYTQTLHFISYYTHEYHQGSAEKEIIKVFLCCLQLYNIYMIQHAVCWKLILCFTLSLC